MVSAWLDSSLVSPAANSRGRTATGSISSTGFFPAAPSSSSLRTAGLTMRSNEPTAALYESVARPKAAPSLPK